MDSLKYEIVLRVEGGSDYCTFVVEGDTSLDELENMIVYMFDWRFDRISGPVIRRKFYVP